MNIETALRSGIVYDLPDAPYHAMQAIGSSPLKKFHDCPAKAFDSIEQTEDMALGSAQDSYSLVGPEHFKRNFIISPVFGHQAKSENKLAKERFIATAASLNLTVLPPTIGPKNLPTMQAIIDVDNFLFKEHEMSKRILRTGSQQVSLFWRDEATGIACKGRLDHQPDPEFRMIVDLKKCAQIDRFIWQMEALRYFMQAGHYSVGAEMNHMDVDAFTFIAFNFGDPPQVKIVTIDDNGGDYFTKCKNLAKTTIKLIAECQEAGKYPRYPIPFETQSMAAILGLKKYNKQQQLTPFMLGEAAPIPRCLKYLV